MGKVPGRPRRDRPRSPQPGQEPLPCSRAGPPPCPTRPPNIGGRNGGHKHCRAQTLLDVALGLQSLSQGGRGKGGRVRGKGGLPPPPRLASCRAGCRCCSCLVNIGRRRPEATPCKNPPPGHLRLQPLRCPEPVTRAHLWKQAKPLWSGSSRWMWGERLASWAAPSPALPSSPAKVLHKAPQKLFPATGGGSVSRGLSFQAPH